ncbi:MAG TPA: FecR family protein, partial [Flavisolibacter sp.]|nr:FecR family protein [Flavisolibacter sp.]
MSLNRYWNLLAKKMAGEATPEELLELQQLLRDNPNFIPAAEQIENLWKLNKTEADAYDAELAFEYHLNRMKEQGIHFTELETPLEVDAAGSIQTKSKKPWVAALAILFVIAATAFLYPLILKPSLKVETTRKAVSEVSTRLGSKTKLLLPDSTIVWLNAGSKLTYNDHFGTTNRNTTLTGEAFFDVRKSSIPFIIKANGVQIKVLGTAFNVKSYPNEKTTETSLVRG